MEQPWSNYMAAAEPVCFVWCVRAASTLLLLRTGVVGFWVPGFNWGVRDLKRQHQYTTKRKQQTGLQQHPKVRFDENFLHPLKRAGFFVPQKKKDKKREEYKDENFDFDF